MHVERHAGVLEAESVLEEKSGGVFAEIVDRAASSTESPIRANFARLESGGFPTRYQ
jgi:hypothetical protein